MGILEFFSRKQPTAAVAKDRLQIIVARERGQNRSGVPYLAELQQELLAVIARYEKLDLDLVTVNVENHEAGEILELNVVLPEPEKPKPSGGKRKKKKRGRAARVGSFATT